MFRRLARLIFPFMGQTVTPLALDALATRTLDPVMVAREAYRQFAIASYQEVAPNPIDPPPLQRYGTDQWRAALDKVSGLQDDGSYTHPTIDRVFAERALTRSDLHARSAERNQTVAYAVNDRDIAGWARIDRTPPTCPLCRLTISRGPVYSSKQAAGGDGNTFHVGCTCEIVLVFKGQEDSWPGIEYYRAEEKRYKDAVKGAGSNRAKAYRQAVAEENARVAGAVSKAAKSAVIE